MRRSPDVLIIGGGVIGLSIAYRLAGDGVSAQILDRSMPGSEASWAGAGIVPPGNPARARTALDQLRATSSQGFPTLSAELYERTGIDNGYRVCGGIEVFEESSGDEIGIWNDEGIEFQPVDAELAATLEPGVRLPPSTAYWLPGMAQVRNPWHVRALLEGCTRRGVEVQPNSPVVQLESSGGRVTAARLENGDQHVAEKYVISAGAWVDQLLTTVGVRSGVHPVRGQIVLFRSSPLRRIVCVGKRYLVPREDGRLLVGSTEEPEAGFEKATTPQGVTDLYAFAKKLVPDLSNELVEKSWAGLRPGTCDGLPFLGAVPGLENAFVAAGHFRAGIQLSIATAQVMSELLTNQSPSIPLADFRLDRPPAAPIPSAFRS